MAALRALHCAFAFALVVGSGCKQQVSPRGALPAQRMLAVQHGLNHAGGPPSDATPAEEAKPVRLGLAVMGSSAPLLQESAGHLSVNLRAGAQIEVLGSRGDLLQVRATQYSVYGAEAFGDEGELHHWVESEGLEGWVPRSRVLSAQGSHSVNLSLPPKCSRVESNGRAKTVRNQLLRIQAEPGAAARFLLTNGGDIAVDAEVTHDDRVWSKVRQLTEGVEVVGWTRDPIRFARGFHNCTPRAVTIDRNGPVEALQWNFLFAGTLFVPVRASSDVLGPFERTYFRSGSVDHAIELLAPPALPPEYLLVRKGSVRAALALISRSRTLYAPGMVGDKPGCVPHKFSAGYLEVEHGDPAGPQARIQRHSMHWSSSGVGLLTIDGPVITDIVGGVPVKTRALMCGHYERIVGMDQDAVLVTRGARTVVAYVPEDMKHLYLDKGVCEAAVHAAFFPPSVENALTANLAALGGMGAC